MILMYLKGLKDIEKQKKVRRNKINSARGCRVIKKGEKSYGEHSPWFEAQVIVMFVFYTERGVISE